MKVVIVNDDVLILNIFKKITEKFFREVESIYFDDSETALKELKSDFKLTNTVPDLFILDVYMPKFNGWEVVEELTKIYSNSNIKIKIFTSSINEDDAIKFKQYPNVIDYVCKPLTVEVVKELFFK